MTLSHVSNRHQTRFPFRASSHAASITGWLCATSLAVTVQAAEFSGKVTGTDGKGVSGALITVSDSSRGIGESTYSDAKGHFRLHTTLVNGAAQLRVRKAYFQDLHAEVGLGKTRVERDLTLQAMTDRKEISESLPALFHFGQIAFKPGTPFARSSFQRDCLSCHQLGNSTTRMPRDVESWENTISRMHKYLGNFDAGLRRQRAELLSAAFNGEPLAVRPVFPFSPIIARATVTQYRLDGTQLPHDAEVSPNDGLVYISDQFGDQLAITNLANGETRLKPVSHEGTNVGGKFARLGIAALGDAASRLYRGPHSLAIGPDGRWYTTDTFATQIGAFNPKTDSWEAAYEIPDGSNPSLYPHTIRFDHQGIAWFTLAFSEQVGRLEPASRKVTVIQLPPGKSLGVAAGTTPYGIDVHPKDGTIWYARLWSDKIGRIDPKTLAITEYDSPVKGPRRLRFDASGHLWIAGYSEGVLARFDTATGKSDLHPLPEFAPGYRPAAYALAVHPKTQEIWVNETMTDHIFRFVPKTNTWVAYPLPLRGSYTREISFTKDGRVCTSNNPFPAGALESGVPELICIDAGDSPKLAGR
jgi:virginiamycin B lyase